MSCSAEPGDPTFDPSVAATSMATFTPSVATCSGNKIDVSCTQAQLPSATPDSGPLSPVCNKAGAGTYLVFNATQASKGASTYCSELTSNKVVLSSSNSPPKPGYVANAAEGDGYIAMTVEFDVDSCDPATSTADQSLRFPTWSADKCHKYLYTNLAETCAKDPSWSDYNANYSIEGGVYGESCALWSLSGLPGSPNNSNADRIVE